MPVKIEQVTKPVLLGEGPHWDERRQVLYYVSIFDRTIHKYDPATNVETKARLPGNTGFVVPVANTDDEFVVGVDRRVLRIRWNGEDESEAKILEEIAEVDKEAPRNTNRLNDGKADPKGRLYAGTMGKEDPPGQFQQHMGSLFVFNKSGARTVADKVHISNGLCWDVKNKKMYYIDSLEYGVRCYDYDFATGKMENQRLIMDWKKHDLQGVPDGMTIDTDGNLWIANFDGYLVMKVDPNTGDVLQKVKIPALQVTSVAFGGENLDELYVTTASMNIREKQEPPRGAVFKVTGLGVKGYAGVPCVL